ncbi:MAG TPA: hypothetical protein VIR57_21115, partial [Chloroflexota bacterium]
MATAVMATAAVTLPIFLPKTPLMMAAAQGAAGIIQRKSTNLALQQVEVVSHKAVFVVANQGHDDG